MSIFDFFKRNKANNTEKNIIKFKVDKLRLLTLSSCKLNDYVQLFTKPDMDAVLIYSAGTIGGNGLLGIVPNNHFITIWKHLLQPTQINKIISGSSTNNYDATITRITNYSCEITIKLFSEEEHKKIIDDIITNDKLRTSEELNKKYKMRSPVKISFNLEDTYLFNIEDLINLKLHIFEKEYYIEDPFNYNILLMNGNEIIGKTTSQKTEIFRILKTHFNGHEIKINNIEKGSEYSGKILTLIVTICTI